MAAAEVYNVCKGGDQAEPTKYTTGENSKDVFGIETRVNGRFSIAVTVYTYLQLLLDR